MVSQIARTGADSRRGQQIRHDAEALAYIKRKYKVADLPESFDPGGIVGIAEITDCVQRHRSRWFNGPFGWVLANARRLPFKRCKGQLKFFNPNT
jgi:hypothetical protein